MIAIIEQNQQKDGSVVIPKVLRSYMDGIEKLGKKWIWMKKYLYY